MKKIALLLSVAVLSLTSISAMADSRRSHRNQSNHHNHANYIGNHHWNSSSLRHNYGLHRQRSWANQGPFISLNFGRSWPNRYSASNYGFSTYGRHSNYREPTRVVYRTNNVVHYVDSARSSRHYSSSRNSPQRSLLRDIEGRCFERTYRDDGIELKTELAPEACDF